ncbi:hypothetical protein [Paraburkholderia rhynchosiae]|uniref:Uncharacterized protein n=1 Tax=Paraburkholderia rhynchosiae TaxID=487049 RepID=A0A2N7WU34_9BURK|nr:hypothetical protein [Paraburkholderia rhynchosiae]PMS32852.1 hypothetical protein C0Z16_04705 [Paraburkholderia rhynchosiae]CAB3645712.1 hypothetical protein LMG27174_00837 [Paraburkholderia rhynchosiae]
MERNYSKKFTPTVLLKAHGSAMSAKAFNVAAVASGLLAEDGRPSSKHPTERRRFLKLTPAGLSYGVNETDEHGTITARWREDTFSQVLDLIGGA